MSNDFSDATNCVIDSCLKEGLLLQILANGFIRGCFWSSLPTVATNACGDRNYHGCYLFPCSFWCLCRAIGHFLGVSLVLHRNHCKGGVLLWCYSGSTSLRVLSFHRSSRHHDICTHLLCDLAYGKKKSACKVIFDSMMSWSMLHQHVTFVGGSAFCPLR